MTISRLDWPAYSIWLICVDTGHGGSWRFGHLYLCIFDRWFVGPISNLYSENVSFILEFSQSAWPNTNVERTVLFNNYSLSELSNQLFISISVSIFSLSALFCGGRVVERRPVSDVWRCCTVYSATCRKSLLALYFHVLRIYTLRSKTNCHHVTTWNISACPCKDLH